MGWLHPCGVMQLGRSGSSVAYSGQATLGGRRSAVTADLQPPVNVHAEQEGRSGGPGVGDAWPRHPRIGCAGCERARGVGRPGRARFVAVSDTSVKVLQDPTVQSTSRDEHGRPALRQRRRCWARSAGFLPAAAKPFAATLAEGLRQPARPAAQRALASERLQDRWRTANERAQRQLLRVIEDDNGAGAVVLDLRPLVLQIEGAATKFGVSGQLPALPANAGQITLLRTDQLSFAKSVVRGLHATANYLVILVVLIFAGSSLGCPPRRKARVRDRSCSWQDSC